MRGVYMLAKNRVVFSIGIFIFILIATIAAIFWARGFKPNLRQAKIERTGIIVASSVPGGANVYLDGRLTSATNTNIGYLDPKTYKVRIEKEGYSTWEKDVEVKADLATEIKALLFPLAPQIKPLTITGAANPNLSPDGTKIVYGTAGERGGLYMLLLSQTPLPFRQDPHLLVKNLSAGRLNASGLDFSKSRFIWSGDSKQVIARFENEKGEAIANLLIETDQNNQEPRDISGSLTSTLAAWQEQINLHAQTLALTVPDEIKAATREAQQATSNMKQVTGNTKPETKAPSFQFQVSSFKLDYFPTGLIFSPDEEKTFYKQSFPADKNREGQYKIYDSKNKKEYTLPDFSDLLNVSWYPDSNHLVIIRKDLVTIIEADGTNNMTVFSGKFEDGFVFANPTGDRLIILTTLTQPEGTPTNLYAINLR